MMHVYKRGQIATEYLIVISFVTFIVISVMGIALMYSTDIKDNIRISQLDKFSDKLTTTSESIFYAGEPSKTTIQVYLPEGVSQIRIINKEIIFNISTSKIQAIKVYESKVSLNGTISTHTGVKNLLISANSTFVNINEITG